MIKGMLKSKDHKPEEEDSPILVEVEMGLNEYQYHIAHFEDGQWFIGTFNHCNYCRGYTVVVFTDCDIDEESECYARKWKPFEE